MRTRNFRVRNDVVERRSVTTSQKGKKAHVERKVGECFQWNAHGQCSKRYSCSFSHHTQASGNSVERQRRKGRSSSPASHSKAKQTDGEGQKSSTGSGKKEENSLDKSEIPCRFKFCKNPSCKFWHPPVCQNYKSEKGCVYGNKCHFRNDEAEGKPNRRSKKGGAKGPVATLKESIQLGCVSQDSYPRNSKGTWHQVQIRETKGPSRGIIQKCAPLERSHCAPKFGEISHEETLHQERCARKAAWDLAKNIYRLKHSDKKLRSILLLKQR